MLCWMKADMTLPTRKFLFHQFSIQFNVLVTKKFTHSNLCDQNMILVIGYIAVYLSFYRSSERMTQSVVQLWEAILLNSSRAGCLVPPPPPLQIARYLPLLLLLFEKWDAGFVRTLKNRELEQIVDYFLLVFYCHLVVCKSITIGWKAKLFLGYLFERKRLFLG